MTPDNIDVLLGLLKQIAESLSLANKYTITGAADWPILAAVGGVFVAVLGFMWRDNRSGTQDIKAEMKDIKAEIVTGMRDIKKEGRSDVDAVWAALKDCQHDCCPRRKDQ